MHALKLLPAYQSSSNKDTLKIIRVTSLSRPHIFFLPQFSSSLHEISTFQYTKIYQLWNSVLQDVREGMSAANTST